MSYLVAVVSVVLIVVGVILLLFPDYSKKKFFESRKDIRMAGVMVLMFAVLFAITDMRGVALYNLLESFNKHVPQQIEPIDANKTKSLPME